MILLIWPYQKKLSFSGEAIGSLATDGLGTAQLERFRPAGTIYAICAEPLRQDVGDGWRFKGYVFSAWWRGKPWGLLRNIDENSGSSTIFPFFWWWFHFPFFAFHSLFGNDNIPIDHRVALWINWGLIKARTKTAGQIALGGFLLVSWVSSRWNFSEAAVDCFQGFLRGRQLWVSDFPLAKTYYLKGFTQRFLQQQSIFCEKDDSSSTWDYLSISCFGVAHGGPDFESASETLPQRQHPAIFVESCETSRLAHQRTSALSTCRKWPERNFAELRLSSKLDSPDVLVCCSRGEAVYKEEWGGEPRKTWRMG